MINWQLKLDSYLLSPIPRAKGRQSWVRSDTSLPSMFNFKCFMCMFKWLKKLFCKEEPQVPQTVVEPVVKVQKEVAVAPKKKRPYKPRAKKKDVNVK